MARIDLQRILRIGMSPAYIPSNVNITLARWQGQGSMGVESMHYVPEPPDANDGEAQSDEAVTDRAASGCDANAMRHVNLLIWWAFSQMNNEDRCNG